MDDEQSAEVDDAPQAWSGEERLVAGAILMVASHGAPRVTVAGLRFGERILESAQRRALQSGVRVRARRTAGGDHVDLVVEVIR